MTRGRALLASGHPGAAVAQLARGLELWRGEPLPDLSNGLTGVTESVRLRELKAEAEEDLFEGRLQLGEHHRLVADLWPAVEAEPLRQRRWAQLMLALYRCNRQSRRSRLRAPAANSGRDTGSTLRRSWWRSTGDRHRPRRSAVDAAD